MYAHEMRMESKLLTTARRESLYMAQGGAGPCTEWGREREEG